VGKPKTKIKRRDFLKGMGGGVAPVPWRLRKAEAALKGARPSEPVIRAAVAKAADEASPLAENAYKVDILGTVVTDAVLKAFKAPLRG